MLLKMLDHPNIVKAYEFLHDEKRGKCRIIQEYVKCENLGRLLQERGAIPGEGKIPN
jgi:serine/threonine protein kinase